MRVRLKTELRQKMSTRGRSLNSYYRPGWTVVAIRHELPSKETYRLLFRPEWSGRIDKEYYRTDERRAHGWRFRGKGLRWFLRRRFYAWYWDEVKSRV